jgi:hypothetical protein
MISAQNHRLPLNGNKWLLFLIIALIAAACSPKVLPVAVQPVKKEAEKPVVAPPPKVVEVKPAPPKVSSISLLLPFSLDHLKPGANYTPESLKEADIATAYYRGFKLALDSLTAKGYNYKLLVFDSKLPVHNLATNPGLKSSNLIVGPVFPDQLKAFTFSYGIAPQPIVSPLSIAPPSTFKVRNLITLNPPLEYHAWAAAKYIVEKLKSKKVFILKSGYSNENDYIIPFTKAIDSLGKNHIKVIASTVLHGQLNSLIPQLSKSEKNVFIVPVSNIHSSDQHFLNVTLHALDTLSNSYPVTVFGHPGWVNLTFLQAALLQRLDTHITSADHIDYKAANTIAFLRAYRLVYHAEANEFAIKGFDQGIYLGTLLATESLKNLDAIDFTGIHNSFQFQKKVGLGWINTHVNLYKYANFELKKLE